MVTTTTKKAPAKKTAKKAVKKKTAQRTVKFVQLIDSSGSMQGKEDAVLLAMNGISEIIKFEAEKIPTRVSMFHFNNETHMIIEDQAASELPKLTRRVYRASGGTALFDAVKVAIESLEKFAKPNDIFVVNVFTDGENTIAHHRIPEIVKLMKEKQETGNWTFTFQLPRGSSVKPNYYRDDFIRNYDVPAGNTATWETTEEGAREMGQVTQAATTDFYDQVSKGATQSRGFYEVQPDLSKVKAKDIAKLEDLSHKFKAFEVDKETPIKEFVEERTKRGYVIGSTYYALTKKETVQAQKEVLLLDIKSKKIYGGDEARGLIGLPQGHPAKVEPGNHGNYIIYVKSTSVNRKLVRGTKILVDTTKIANDPATWDHTQVGRGPVAEGRRAAKKAKKS